MKKFVCVALAALVSTGCQKAPAASQAPAASSTTAAAPGAAGPGSVPDRAQVPTLPEAVGTAGSQAPSPAGSAQAPGSVPQPSVKPVPAALPDVLARVNGEAVNRADLERAVRVLEQRAGRPVPAEQRDQVVRGVLDQLVAVRLLTQEARARKIAVSDADIDQRIAALRKQFPSEDDFTKAISSRGTTLENLKQEARQELSVAKMLQAEVGPKISVQDADVKAFYDKNPQQFQQPETFRASHILIRVETSATPDQKKAARERIDGLLKQVRAGGDFAELAKANSQDSSASNGGDLNYFGRGQMVPAFEQAVVALKVGQVSDVVETPFGYHVIKLTEIRPARTVPLAEVSTRIGQFLVAQAQQQKTAEFVQALRAKGKVEILI